MEEGNIQFDQPVSEPAPNVQPTGTPPIGVQPQVAPPQATPPPQKIGKFKASLIIAKESWNLMVKDKEVMLFPIISSLVSFVVIGIICSIFFLVSLNGNWSEIENTQRTSSGTDILYALIVYFITFFITIFFQTGIITIVHARLNGQDLNFSDGMRNAVRKSGKIMKWALVAATVGVILRLIAERSKILGRIVIALLGAVWSILTFFIAPVLILEDLSIKDSLKKSALVIKQVWGETVIVNVGVGLFFMMLILAGTLLYFVLLIVSGIMMLVPLIIVLTVLWIIFIIGMAIISSTLDVIFQLVLYEYATTGKLPAGFSQEVISMAFKQGNQKKGIIGIGGI
jgi:hypothetical protein